MNELMTKRLSISDITSFPFQTEILKDTPIANKETIYQAYSLSSGNNCVIKRIVIDSTVVGTEDIEETWATITGRDHLELSKKWADRASYDYTYLIF